MRALDLAGKRFGRLVARERAGTSDGKILWRCLCDCGTEAIVRSVYLRSGHTTSCGCWQGHRLNPATKNAAYKSWRKMLERCTNPNARQWKWYGGRGITICQRWRDSFDAFLADMGERPAATSIDRIDTNGNYEPGNCRWATAKEQANNRRPRIQIVRAA